MKQIISIIIAVIALYGLSWLLTCGIIKLITLCFGWTFTWPVATGIWLVLCLAESFLKTRVTK